MATLDEIKIEQAAQRLDIAALRSELRGFMGLFDVDELTRASEQRERVKRQTGARYKLIRDFARYLPPDNIEQTGKRMEQIIDGKIAAPDGAADIVAKLRRAYGVGGLCTRTVRRALACQN